MWEDVSLGRDHGRRNPAPEFTASRVPGTHCSTGKVLAGPLGVGERPDRFALRLSRGGSGHSSKPSAVPALHGGPPTPRTRPHAPCAQGHLVIRPSPLGTRRPEQPTPSLQVHSRCLSSDIATSLCELQRSLTGPSAQGSQVRASGRCPLSPWDGRVLGSQVDPCKVPDSLPSDPRGVWGLERPLAPSPSGAETEAPNQKGCVSVARVRTCVHKTRDTA